MSDGTEDIAQSPAEVNDAARAAMAVPEPEPQAETPEAEGETPVIDDSEEIEFDGEKFKIPRKLKDGFLMQADYTRKTQELARMREAVEARATETAKEAETRKGLEKEIGRLSLMDEQLESYQKVDWSALRAANPEQANAHFQDYVQLRDQRENLAGKVQRDVTERSQKQQQDLAKRYAETNATLARDIKGWNQELADNLRNFAIASGIDQHQLVELATNAAQVKLLHKAWLGEQLSTAKQTAIKPPAIEPKPVAKVSGASPKASVNLFDADMEKYVSERRKQGFGKR